MSILNLNKRFRSSNQVPLVIGGNAAGEDEFPWIAAIAKRKWNGSYKIICGGSRENSIHIHPK